jgi:hypothetical protein
MKTKYKTDWGKIFIAGGVGLLFGLFTMGLIYPLTPTTPTYYAYVCDDSGRSEANIIKYIITPGWITITQQHFNGDVTTNDVVAQPGCRLLKQSKLYSNWYEMREALELYKQAVKNL